MVKSVTIGDIYSLFQKYGDLGISVSTPYGYKHIEACDITAHNSDVIRITTDNNKVLDCSPSHLVKSKNGKFISTSKLIPGQSIQTIDGNSDILSLELLTYKQDLYDIQVADVKQYYSNGIVSHNSSILDAVSFCIFDKCSRTFRASAILNNKSNSFWCELHSKINGIDYHIRREARTINKGKNVKVDVQFWKVEDGVSTLLNGTERRDTNSIIEQYFGRYEDFLLTALSVQGNNALFIDKSQTERKDLLAQFMGLTVFDKLYETANEDIREVSTLIKNFKRTDFTTELAEKQTELKKKKVEFGKLDSEIKQLEINRGELDSKIIELTKDIVPIDSKIDLDELTTKQNSIESHITKIVIGIYDKSEKLISCNELLAEVSQSMEDIKTVNGIEIDEAKSQWDTYTAEISNINHKIELLTQSVSSNLEKLSHLESHEYDPTCKFCMNNVFVKDAIATHTIVEEQKQELGSLSEIHKELIDKLKPLTEADTQWKNWTSLKNKYQKDIVIKEKGEAELKGLKTKKELYEANLKEIGSDIQRYYDNVDSISNNKFLIKQISEINTQKRELETILAETKRQLLKTTAETGSIKTFIDTTRAKMKEIKELETKNQLYTFYLEAVKRDGIPYELITNALPIVQNEINNILSQVVDFHIIMDTDGKNINAKIVYDDNEWALEMCSGMEKFISGLAIRVALINICNLPRPNFLVIDEGMGSLDSENLASLYMMFSYLKNQFDFIILISHLDSIRDVVDGFIDIKRESGFSKVRF